MLAKFSKKLKTLPQADDTRSIASNEASAFVGEFMRIKQPGPPQEQLPTPPPPPLQPVLVPAKPSSSKSSFPLITLDTIMPIAAPFPHGEGPPIKPTAPPPQQENFDIRLPKFMQKNGVDRTYYDTWNRKQKIEEVERFDVEQKNHQNNIDSATDRLLYSDLDGRTEPRTNDGIMIGHTDSVNVVVENKSDCEQTSVHKQNNRSWKEKYAQSLMCSFSCFLCIILLVAIVFSLL